jgi:hypothetical protein
VKRENQPTQGQSDMKIFKKADSQPSTPNNSPPETRRTFLQKIGLGGMLAGLIGVSWQSFRSLIPNVLYEPPQRFKIGLPTNLAEGMTFLEDKRLYIFKEGNLFTPFQRRVRISAAR